MRLKVGIYNLHTQARGGGEKRTLVLAEHLSRGHSVFLFHGGALDVPALERYFDVDLSRVRPVALRSGNHIDGETRRRRFTGRWEETRERLDHFRKIRSFGLDIFVNNSYGSALPCPAPLGIYMCMFPPVPLASSRAERFPRRAYHKLLDSAERRLVGHAADDFINSYSAVTANSRFTADWAREVWGRRCEVVYSACDRLGPSGEKERLMLNVGRFTAAAPGVLLKRQYILLEAFRGLDRRVSDGWQLHFAGSVRRDAETLALVARLEGAAAGLPVFFHFDADLEALRRLYRRASIYWHATGYGSPAAERPDLQEHFGMTTVEAMSAGAVPVVINSGGHGETVTHAADGLLWDEPSELACHTERLMADPRLMARLAERAVSSSARFSRSAFNAGVDSIIERLVRGG
jgi:glycosyltransferase involved in cell wall biosynthesis